MNDQNAIALVKEVFNYIKQSQSDIELKEIFNKPDIKEHLEKYKMDTDTYPKIEFSITPDEIRTLQKNNIIQELALQIKDYDPLTKLLYAVLWKNGDLKKIKHIISGIRNSVNQIDEQTDGLVFYQFGKYLAEPSKEPIIDQHVIRAFAVYLAEDNEPAVLEIRKLGVLNKKHKDLIDKYKGWVAKNHQYKGRDFLYCLDQLLFATGKAIKFRTNRK